ncbi:DNA modification methylase [Candidatus Peregrinibacteria bacterium]|nr:MAG: DNA modification methylase [Candidatus Peregrinibacteria bacterium]
MKIEYVPIKDLQFADYNPRAATKKEAQELKKSLERFGFVEPVVVNSDPKRKNIIIGGHFRVRTAKDLGLKEVPVHYIKISDEKKERELNLRLNKNLGHWDAELLVEFDENLLLDVGFESDELDKLFEGLKLDDPDSDKDDEVPELAEDSKTQIGDVWQLGRHRIMCGDATNMEHVITLMEGKQADVVFTDPPYNVNYKGRGQKTSNGIANDNMEGSAFGHFLEKVFKNYREAIKTGAGLYVFHSSSSQSQFEYAIEKAGLEVKNQLIWNKPAAALGWGDYRWKHEPFFYCAVKSQKVQFYGDRKHSTVWDFQKTDAQLFAWAQKMKRAEEQGKTTIWTMSRDKVGEYVHPTQKPVELIVYALRNSSKSDDLVLDLFLGSGSTLIAAEKSERTCYGLELDPKYIDVIIKRWEDYTGEKAELVAPVTRKTPLN